MALGGVWDLAGEPASWSAVNDDQSIRAVPRSKKLGAKFLDLALNYDEDHGKRILEEPLQSEAMVKSKQKANRRQL
jgi:hypothetical protein